MVQCAQKQSVELLVCLVVRHAAPPDGVARQGTPTVLSAQNWESESAVLDRRQNLNVVCLFLGALFDV